MKFDVAMLTQNPLEAKGFALQAEEAGFSGVYTFEGQHDPFLPLAIAAGSTQSLDLMTGIAVAFGRSPLTLAHTAYDLQLMSRGRFILGIGTQVKAHIQRRYSMPWSKPAARMREFVLALRAIWECWQTGGKLAFEGAFYHHTLMTPTFSPGPNPHGVPKVFLAGVGPKMVAVAGEVADGYIVHPFHTVRHLREHSLPALKRGLASRGLARGDMEISCQIILGTGFTPDDIAQATETARRQIGFYASTPAYLPVLECMDRVDIHQPLLDLSRQGKWNEMGALVDDVLLHEVAAIGTPEQAAEHIIATRGALVDRISPVAYGKDIALYAAVGKALGVLRES
ncbi:putative oxidoreductase [Caenibius tardaugens NBRC 16725]|uniref:Putative oxidoreductase n=1 Tax=Caenibius tardaugens NBRC 16725 TaxID=1219035 RepID=U2YHI4_9SPHN|nr:TIGR03617 family F420-dependent LLM class oxidoreductase [Caenibius tardaugens]GAD47337.1 putative oxidoreductase [Caenibius tardaugens NBRC 16725]